VSATMVLVGETDYAAITVAAQQYPAHAEEAINSVLHGEAGPVIYRSINPLIHASGRTFKGHSVSATAAHWPEYRTGENLAVTVAANGAYRYLYFPDDGSNTKRHAGNQQFFRRGAEAVIPQLVERCVEAITSAWDG